MFNTNICTVPHELCHLTFDSAEGYKLEVMSTLDIIPVSRFKMSRVEMSRFEIGLLFSILPLQDKP